MTDYTNMYITFGILALTMVFFVNGRIRSDIVALCSLLLLLFFGILTPDEALPSFASPVVIMMIGLFVVGGAIFQTGLAKMISSRILRFAGDSETRLLVLIMIVTAGLGAFVSNTGTVALMMPIVFSIAASASMSPSRLLMPLAFASSMGTFTLISTPPNLFVDDLLRNETGEGLGFFSFIPIGLIALTVGLIVLIPLSKWILSKKDDQADVSKGDGKSLEELAKEYKLGSNLHRVKVKRDSEISGKTIIDLNVRRKYDIIVLEIRREPSSGSSRFFKSVSQRLAIHTKLQEGDVLYLMGDIQNVKKFSADHSLHIINDKESSDTESIEFYDIGIAEVLLLPTSTMDNKTLDELGLRETYNINVLGVRRKKEYILTDLQDVRFASGDVLLVQGKWKDIGRLSDESKEWVVMGQPLEQASKVTLDHKAPVAALIMVLMVIAMTVDAIPVAPVTAVLGAAVLMVLTGCFKNVEAAYKTINWESIVLIAAMLPMSTALQKTGAAGLIATGLAENLGSNPWILLGGVYLATSVMTLFISNTATAVLLAPIAFTAAHAAGVSPIPFMYAVATAASMCFASPFSTPPNALVMSAGRYTFMDYVKVGLPLQAILAIVMIIALPLLFPF